MFTYIWLLFRSDGTRQFLLSTLKTVIRNASYVNELEIFSSIFSINFFYSIKPPSNLKHELKNRFIQRFHDSEFTFDLR